MIDRPNDYRDVVHPVREQTRVYVTASTPPCIKLRDEAARPNGRDYWTVRMADLKEISPPKQWLLAAILCPGDHAQQVVDWLQENNGEPERVVFILHSETDPVHALAPWYATGHGDPIVIEASTWKQMARPLGQFVNDWIYLQAKGMDWPL